MLPVDPPAPCCHSVRYNDMQMYTFYADELEAYVNACLLDYIRKLTPQAVGVSDSNLGGV